MKHFCNDMDFASGYNSIGGWLKEFTIEYNGDTWILEADEQDSEFDTHKLLNGVYVQGLGYCPFCGEKL